jgi:hypothetical protein
MELAGQEPGANGTEKHTFKCPQCEFSKTKISGDPTRYRAARKKRKPDAATASGFRKSR